MSRKKQKPKPRAAAPQSASASVTKPGPTGWKLWRFRLLLIFLAPLLCFLLLEFALRLAGFGYPTQFLLPASKDGRAYWKQNNQFGWRFFGRQMSRSPASIFMPQTKAANTVRVFVFGESAAFGDPQPRFGLPRMLEATLELRHPGTHFEVINAAMTAINSHTILPIARDCAKAGGDLWVIYMGNNEVVGPFGAGTVFGPQSPPLAFIRASLALKTTRFGQWLDSLRQKLEKPPPGKSEWGGMEMFLDQQVSADDRRMNAVYDHFRRNLADIIKAGENAGAQIVLSTVPVNLKDCAPFASAHHPGLTEPDKQKWEQTCKLGVEAQEAGENEDAIRDFQQAEVVDDKVAELHFRQAWCELALGHFPDAQTNFSAARDLDTLRFRCDTRLNELIRQAAANDADKHLVLADSELAFAQHSADGIPGGNLFYEHVHLTFEGNYLLARTIARRVDDLLPSITGGNAIKDGGWPSLADCAQRLAWTDWSRQAALSEILTRLEDPPFTAQMDHSVQVRRLTQQLQKLASADQPSGIKEAREATARAVGMAPDDPVLLAQLATLDQLSGDLPGAAAAIKKSLDLLPSSGENWSQLGSLEVQQQDYGKAEEAFREAFKLDPEDVWSLQNLAMSLKKLDRRDEAIRTYQLALSIKPRFGLAWLGLGQIWEETGLKSKAEECYHKALENPIHRAPELTTLARFCVSRGWFDEAATNYAGAVKLSPADAPLRVEAGENLDRLKRWVEADEYYSEAIQLAPNLATARFLHGVFLGRNGKSAEAAQEFRNVVQIMPDLLEARLNLAIALMRSGSNTEALAEYGEVLKRSPTNAIAIRDVSILRAKLTPAAPH